MSYMIQGEGKFRPGTISLGTISPGENFATLEIPKAPSAIRPNDGDNTTRHAPDGDSKTATHHHNKQAPAPPSHQYYRIISTRFHTSAQQTVGSGALVSAWLFLGNTIPLPRWQRMELFCQKFRQGKISPPFLTAKFSPGKIFPPPVLLSAEVPRAAEQAAAWRKCGDACTIMNLECALIGGKMLLHGTMFLLDSAGCASSGQTAWWSRALSKRHQMLGDHEHTSHHEEGSLEI